MTWQLMVKKKFSAAHFLNNYRGKCENMHGHTFVLEAHFTQDTLDRAGISIDFSLLKEYLGEILPDHQVLNERYDFSPSAENLSRHFYRVIKEKYPSLSKVIIWESDNAGCEYTED